MRNGVPLLEVHGFTSAFSRTTVRRADGNALPPTGVGLGVEVDETMFAKVNADPKRQFKWPHPTYQDGSVRDY